MTKNFTAVGVSDVVLVPVGETFTYAVSGTFVGTVKLERQERNKAEWVTLVTATGAASGSFVAEEPSGKDAVRVRFRCTAYTSGTVETEIESVSTDYVANEVSPAGNSLLEYTEDGPRLADSKSLLGPAEEYDGSSSYQPVGPDLSLAAGAGRDDPDTSHLAAVMGNVLGSALTKTGNYTAGVIGAYSVESTNAARYGKAGVLGKVSDGTVSAHAGVVSVLDGDSAVTTAGAFFKALNHNSVPGSGVDYGIDLASGHDAYPEIVPGKAVFRGHNDFCILVGSGAPVDGTTGDNFAGPGSFYVDYANGNLYLQTSLVTTPVWKLVTRAA